MIMQDHLPGSKLNGRTPPLRERSISPPPGWFVAPGRYIVQAASNFTTCASSARDGASQLTTGPQGRKTDANGPRAVTTERGVRCWAGRCQMRVVASLEGDAPEALTV